MSMIELDLTSQQWLNNIEARSILLLLLLLLLLLATGETIQLAYIFCTQSQQSQSTPISIAISDCASPSLAIHYLKSEVIWVGQNSNPLRLAAGLGIVLVGCTYGTSRESCLSRPNWPLALTILIIFELFICLSALLYLFVYPLFFIYLFIRSSFTV
jgi:hypothetical protein